MKFALSLTMLLAWALWLGGTIATIVIGRHLFNVLPHDDVAGPAANAMFHVFAQYELVLTAVAVFSSGFLLITYPSKGYLLLVFMFILSAGMVIIVSMGFMPAMDYLIEQGKQNTPQFIHLHVRSMIVIATQSVLLLLTGPVILKLMGTAAPLSQTQQNKEDADLRSEFEKSKGVPRGL
jgi:hypothetical protein